MLRSRESPGSGDASYLAGGKAGSRPPPGRNPAADRHSGLAWERGLPLPAAAYVMSPYADLTLAGTTIDTKSKADPLLSRELLQPGSPTTPPGKTPLWA